MSKGTRLNELRNLRDGLLFISPWIIGFLVFSLNPIFQALYYSFTDFSSFLRAPKWAGLTNYKKMFTDDMFYTVIKNTFYMITVGGVLVILSTLTIAILLDNKRLKNIQGFRVIFFLPTLVPSIVLCILWVWLLNPDTGLINTVLALFGIKGPGWLSSLFWSKPAFVLMRIWGAGNLIIIFLGGLQDIPRDMYEAVEIDGGNTWHKIFHITIPMLRPIILFNVINTLNGLMQMFVEPLVMTRPVVGGPMNRTYTYALYVYQNSFTYGNMGYSCALSFVMLLVTMILTVIALKSGGYFNDSESHQ